jgi:uncharacterized RDD family membrane protein YckC
MRKLNRTYHPHEGERMEALAGAPLASFTKRLLAFGVDFSLGEVLFIYGGLQIAPFILGILIKLHFLTPGNFKLNYNFHEWPALIFLTLYFGLATYFGNGQTLGKWMFGIRVVSLTHQRITLWTAIERALGYGASVLEFGSGFLQYFVNPNHRTVHDRIAETIVVEVWRSNWSEEGAAAERPLDRRGENVSSS